MFDITQLTPNTKQAAKLLMLRFPGIRFTSGRRSIQDQARVMAYNTIAHGPAWLSDTYKDRKMVNVLMTHVEENPEQLRDHSMLTSQFHDLLLEHFGAKFKKMPHVVGRAFDVAWPRDSNRVINRVEGEKICQAILDLPAELGLELLLKKEGKLDVIHAQFATSEDTVLV